MIVKHSLYPALRCKNFFFNPYNRLAINQIFHGISSRYLSTIVTSSVTKSHSVDVKKITETHSKGKRYFFNGFGHYPMAKSQLYINPVQLAETLNTYKLSIFEEKEIIDALIEQNPQLVIKHLHNYNIAKNKQLYLVDILEDLARKVPTIVAERLGTYKMTGYEENKVIDILIKHDPELVIKHLHTYNIAKNNRLYLVRILEDLARKVPTIVAERLGTYEITEFDEEKIIDILIKHDPELLIKHLDTYKITKTNRIILCKVIETLAKKVPALIDQRLDTYKLLTRSDKKNIIDILIEQSPALKVKYAPVDVNQKVDSGKPDIAETIIKDFLGNKVTSSVEDKSTSYLKQYTFDLTEAALQKKIDPIEGREKETHRLLCNILRRDTPHAILLGEAGVGKTAIAEALAIRISEKEVPDSLTDKKVLALDLGKLLAGIKYIGTLEERMNKLVQEIEKAKNIILFIDEIHKLKGAGSTSKNASGDLSNFLKPILTNPRSHVRIIGATTYKEYKETLAEDGAVARRFANIDVPEPDDAQCLKMLQRKIHLYAEHHGCIYTEDALRASIKYSKPLEGHFPAKAFALLDQAGAFVQMQPNNSKQVDAETVRQLVENRMK